MKWRESKCELVCMYITHIDLHSLMPSEHFERYYYDYADCNCNQTKHSKHININIYPSTKWIKCTGWCAVTWFLFSERCAEWVMGINPIGVSLMDVSLTISFRDRTLTDGMQIVNLSEMSWLTGMPWETRHQDVGGEFVSGKDAFTFSFGYLTCSVILRLTDMSVTVYSRSVFAPEGKKGITPTRSQAKSSLKSKKNI